jgi:hypothetical protein
MNNPYIIGTIAYSIENYKCHPQNIKQCIKTFTLSTCNRLDVDGFINFFSCAIYELFTIHLTSEYLKDGIYGIGPFSNDINKLTYSNVYTTKWLKILKDRVSNFKSYINEHHNEHKKVLGLLNNNSINKDNVYLFIQGHALMSFLVKNIVFVCKKLISSRISDLKKNNSEGDVKKYIKQVYRNQTDHERVRQIIDDTNNLEICYVYEQVKQKILKALPQDI